MHTTLTCQQWAQAVWLSAMVGETSLEVDARMVQLLAVLETEVRPFFESGKANFSETIYWQALQVNNRRSDIYFRDERIYISVGQQKLAAFSMNKMS